MKKFLVLLCTAIVIILINGLAYADICNGLVAYYPFNGNADDASGNYNHGAIYGATLTTDKDGNANSAYQFDGVDDYIEITNDPSLNEYDNLSILAWIKTDSGGRIIQKMTWRDCSGIRSGWMLHCGENLAGNFGVGTPPDDKLPGFIADAIAINDGKWHFIGLTWDDANDTVKLYIDGQEALSAFEDRHINSNTRPVIIGKMHCYDQNHFAGVIDEVRIYNRTLSGNEIKSIYDSDYFLTDSDEDGVIDLWDLCADTPIGSVINSDGCPAKNKVVVVPLY
jgi:hypothetical protein